MNRTSGQAGMNAFRKSIASESAHMYAGVCSGFLFYPLQEGFEISLADVTFSDGDALKID